MTTLPQIEIKKPCHENWNAMKLNEKGRFCTSCQTIVIDFTTKTPEEISSILSATSNQHTCGHFNRWDVKTDNKIDNLIWKLNTKGFRYATLLFMSILILVGCRSRKGRVKYTNGSIHDNANSKVEIHK